MYDSGGNLLRFMYIYLICASCSPFCKLFCEAMPRWATVKMYQPGKDFSDAVSSKLLASNDSGEVFPTTPKEGSKQLRDKCYNLYDCSDINAICYFGVCTCRPGYYEYYSSVHRSSFCQRKKRFNETCVQNLDCERHDPYSMCFYQRCRCMSQTRFIKRHNSEGKCYKTGLQGGDICEIDEQCQVSGFKCKCSVSCICSFIHNSGNSIKIENILIGVFASMVSLIGVQLVVLFIRKWFKASRQPEQRHLSLEEPGESAVVVPSAPLEEVSQMTVSHSNYSAISNSDANDLPPSYEDVCKNDKNSCISSPPDFFEAVKINRFYHFEE